MAYVSVFFCSVILFAIYSASIISFLTVSSPTLPFNTLSEFVQHGTYKLIVIRGSAEHEMFQVQLDGIIT